MRRKRPKKGSQNGRYWGSGREELMQSETSNPTMPWGVLRRELDGVQGRNGSEDEK